jgi:hypothetical protein
MRRDRKQGVTCFLRVGIIVPFSSKQAISSVAATLCKAEAPQRLPYTDEADNGKRERREE